MLPGLIAARVIFSKVAGQAGPARPYIRRPFQSRHTVGLRRISSGPSTRYRRHTIISNDPIPPTSEDTSDTDQSDADQKEKSIDQPKIDKNADPDWKPIYRFDAIKWAGLISRFKIFQTIFTTGFVPFAVYQYVQNQAEWEVVETTCSIAIFALTMLYIMSGYLRRCIGVISIHTNKQEIRIGYLTFWGWRRNVIVPIDDVMPLDECNVDVGPRRQKPAFLRVRRYSDSKFILYLPLWKANYVDQKTFQDVFGKLVFAEVKKTK